MIKTMRSITFEQGDYKPPARISRDSLPDSQPTVQVLYEDIFYAGEHGVTWELLEANYMVDADTLRQYLEMWYEKGKAQMQINVLDAMVTTAIDEKNTIMLKWLSSNWLGMSEKATQVAHEAPVDEQAVNDKLSALIEKHNSSPTILKVVK